MRILRALLYVAFLVLFEGCATDYQRAGATGGFTEVQRSRNEFTVAFSGNGYTSGQRAVDLCMLRCAELSLGHHFRYYVLIESKSAVDESTSITTENYIPTRYGAFSFSTTEVVQKPSTVNTILCFRNKPQMLDNVFDAQKVYDDLAGRYNINKSVEMFPEFNLTEAGLGLDLESYTAPTPPNLHGGSDVRTAPQKPMLIVRAFRDGSRAREAGILLGDKIIAVDGNQLSGLGDLGEKEMSWTIGQTVQVTIKRDGKTLVIPVTATFNSALSFKRLNDFKAEGSVNPTNVVVFEKSMQGVKGIPVAEYVDWENPLTTVDEIRGYMALAAINEGANGVLILDSTREIKNYNSKADYRAGFMCVLMVVPQAQLGLDFETGGADEHKYVIRRVLSSDATSAGVHIGDSVLAIDGIDLQQDFDGAVANEMKWKIGQSVQVTVARDGQEVNFQLKTVPNLPQKTVSSN